LLLCLSSLRDIGLQCKTVLMRLPAPEGEMWISGIQNRSCC
jgi:hypothetical protein